ncbi:MAG: hypothetical protein EBY04_07255, partial [Actinobacteria bacterium]|nr:hypothetical protein [Actinomycetota bacterium]
MTLATQLSAEVLAVEVPYWGQSLLRVLGGIVAVLLPAGTIVYVFLFKMMLVAFIIMWVRFSYPR